MPQQFHVAGNTKNTYLLYQCLQDLGVVGLQFPRAGEAWQYRRVARIATQRDTCGAVALAKGKEEITKAARIKEI